VKIVKPGANHTPCKLPGSTFLGSREGRRDSLQELGRYLRQPLFECLLDANGRPLPSQGTETD